MDNHVVVGVGNIYANEALFAARIDPRRAANSLDAAACARLVAEVREVLTRAIAAGGARLVVERPRRETGLTLEEIQKKLMEEENA